MAMTQIREQYKEIAVKIAVAVGLCAILFHFIIRPVYSESTLIRQQIQESHERLELFKDVQRLKDELLVTEQPFLGMAARSLLLGRISDIANKDKLDVRALTPKTTPAGEYVNLRIEMSAQATFISLLNFLKKVEAVEPPFSIGNLSLIQLPYVATRDNPGGKLQVRLSLDTRLIKQVRKSDNP